MRHLNRKTGRKGQGLIEYILVVFLMGIACIGLIQHLKSSTQSGFDKSSNKLDSAFGG